MPVIPEVRTVWRTSTASNQPQRRGRPVTVPNSLPRSPRKRADLAEILGRERPLADPRRVGLGDPEHIADRRRPEPRPGRGLSGDGVRRGHERIGAVVVVEQRTLRALEQDARAGPALLVEQPPDLVDERQDVGAQPPSVRRRSPAARSRLRPMPRRSALWCASSRSILTISVSGSLRSTSADRAATDLVLVGRTDAALGGADLEPGIGVLADRVELAVQRQDQRRIVGDAQDLRA